MNKATPINAIQMDNDTSPQQTPLVQNILSEIQESETNLGGGLGNDYNAQDTYINSQQNQYERQTDNVFMPESNQHAYNFPIEPSKEKEESLPMKILNAAKSPLVVLVLFVFFSLPLFDKYLGILIPRFFVNNQTITMFGILFKSVLVSVLFFFVNRI